MDTRRTSLASPSDTTRRAGIDTVDAVTAWYPAARRADGMIDLAPLTTALPGPLPATTCRPAG